MIVVKLRKVVVILLFLLPLSLYAIEYPDSAIYQGINLKLDLGNSVFELARSKAMIHSYEGALNVDLMHRYYPVAEFGYSQADLAASSGEFSGKGGFFRVGLDLSMLKKRNPRNMLLIGLRIGTAVQGCSTRGVIIGNDYWGYNTVDYNNRVRGDVWGEVCAGVQVQVYKFFHMGWYFRYKVLFSRGKTGSLTAYYIPGYGYKDDSSFSFNYYIGFKL